MHFHDHRESVETLTMKDIQENNSLMNVFIDMVFKWRGNDYNLPSIDLTTSTLDDIKILIEDLTDVKIQHQKIIGLIKTGKLWSLYFRS